MINFIKRLASSLFRKDLTKILSVFDKALRDLDNYIVHTEDSFVAAQKAAEVHGDNLAQAQIVKGNLINLTSTAKAVQS